MLRAEYRRRELRPGPDRQRGPPPDPVRDRRPRRPSILRSPHETHARILSLASVASLSAAAPGLAKVQVVTSLQDFASIADAVGGDRVETFALARATRTRTSSSPSRPSCSSSRSADLLIVAGLELEVGYLPPLIDQSRNAKIRPGSPGYLDASAGCEILRAADRHGDPRDGRRASLRQPALLAGSRERPDHRPRDRGPPRAARPRRARPTTTPTSPPSRRSSTREREALGRDARALRRHQARHVPQLLAELRSSASSSWRPATSSPSPASRPRRRHIVELIDLMQAKKIPVILVEPYFDRKTPEFDRREDRGHGADLLSRRSAARPEIKDYFAPLRHDVDALVDALARRRIRSDRLRAPAAGLRRQPDPDRHPRLPRRPRRRARRHLRRPLAGPDRGPRDDRGLPRGLRPALRDGLPLLARLHLPRRGDLRVLARAPQDAHPAGGRSSASSTRSRRRSRSW